MAAAARRLLERRMKELLLDAAERAGIDPEELAEWLFYAAGVRAKPEWGSLRRAVLRSDVSAQELAAFLVTEGVEVPEEDLVLLAGRGVLIGGRAPRVPRGAGRASAPTRPGPGAEES